MNSVKKLAPLTTLRFFAAAMIVIGHGHGLFGSFGIATHFSLSQGVSFFFTLSGFILAYNYRLLSNSESVKRFLVARLARIWPLHIATLLIWLVIISPNITHDLNSSFESIIKLITNALLLQSWSFTAPWILSFNGVAWSISTEFFFYIIFAFVFINPKKRLSVAIVLSCIFLIAFITVATTRQLSQEDGSAGFTMFSVLYTNPLVRIFEFIIGVCCSKLFFKLKEGLQNTGIIISLAFEIIAIVVTIYAVYLAASPSIIFSLLGSGASYYFYKSGIWIAWGFLILTFSLSNGYISKILSLKPFVFLGEISFALYLIHMIIFNVAYHFKSHVTDLGFLAPVIFWCTCIAASAVLHILIEKPCRKKIMTWWDDRG